MNRQHEQIRQAIYDDLSSFEPTFHIPLQFDTNHKPKDIETLKRYVRVVMGRWERAMLGARWRRNHITFRMIAEKNAVYGWHGHILLKDQAHNKREIHNKFQTAKKKPREPIPDLLVLRIKKTPARLHKYVLKHIWPDGTRRIDTSVWIPSEELFNLSLKPTPTDTP
ncbi:MAG: hypothetical protein LBO08_01725 [Rickettsiales bacterium]|nr:hypothetical protein [Rickettsiales bacterium]